MPDTSKVVGMGDCSTGEVWLLGNYVHLGVNNEGSFGTATKLDTSYYWKKMGIIADYAKDGFATGSPGFSGDYFVPSLALEGFVMNYAQSGSSVSTMNMGLLRDQGQATQNAVAISQLVVTSSDDHQSALWVGTDGDLQVSQVIHFHNDQLHFTTSVVIKNTGSVEITDLYCKCSMRNTSLPLLSCQSSRLIVLRVTRRYEDNRCGPRKDVVWAIQYTKLRHLPADSNRRSCLRELS
jgi:hypothetical protein